VDGIVRRQISGTSDQEETTGAMNMAFNFGQIPYVTIGPLVSYDGNYLGGVQFALKGFSFDGTLEK